MLAGSLTGSRARPGAGPANRYSPRRPATRALIELAKAIAVDPDAGRRWAAEPLPLTGQLTATMTVQYTALPQASRAALLLAAAADSPDLTAGAVAGLTASALAPGEAAGLIRLTTSGPQLTHPLVRSAVYHAAPFAERAAAHLKIADGLGDQPDRYAWHLAAATLEPAEQVAALLEDSAAQAQRRGGTAAAARALERAAELTPGERDKVRRLLTAAGLALSAGQADWVRELAGKVLTLTSDPDLRIAARLNIGWSLLWSDRNTDALEILISLAAESSPGRPALAWDATAMAATVAHQTGLPEASVKARAALAALDALGEPVPSTEDWPASRVDELRIWIAACTDPFGERAKTVPYLHRIGGGLLTDMGKVGGAAWILDETELAVKVLREALSRLRAPGVRGTSGAVLSVLVWACIDSGRWNDALTVAREANDVAAAAYKMITVATSADLTVATVLAMRGDHDQAATILARVLAAVDTSEYLGCAARARHAAGLTAIAQGSYVTAYAQLSQLFTPDGTPLHHHFSYLAIPDLAAAAARAGRRLETSTLLERALARIDPAPGPRLEQLTARARGLLADPADAEAYFLVGLASPVGSTWPFERAQLQLDYGQWLRRQRRINDAKPVLTAARETFRHLGAAPWTRRAESELRACGVTVQATHASPHPLDKLTAKEREIVILAGRGLTNGEIADSLFLSSRTVASHLYRSYPKLGVAGRHQLRDLIDRAEMTE
jgi:DNA-binding CsgD family transcriptional regulator